VTTNNTSDQHIKSIGGGKEKKATQSQKERAQAKENEKGEVANAKEEEIRQIEVIRRVAGTVAPYAGPPSVKAPRRSLGVPRKRGASARETASGRPSDGGRASGNHWASH
jgi:hypothetical protein